MISLGRLLRVLSPLLAIPTLLAGQSPTSLSVADRQSIDAVFKDYNAPHAPGCALGVFRNGHIAYGRGYGWADLEHHVPITTASLFDIGSTSKQFAAASIALLAEDHKLAFSDDVRKYIPELPEYGATITIDHLMRHTSGLRDYNGLLVLAGHTFEEVTTDSQALALITRQRHLNFPPGSRYEYSNTGYFLLSVIVHRVSGQTLADFARARIFRPLGMTHTLYRDRAAMLIPNRAMGYAPNDSGFKNSMSNWEQTGDGAVQLSIDDALRWDENFYHPKVGGQWMVDQLQTRGTLANGDSINYARGLFVHPYRGLRRIEHGGDWIGYHAAYARFPDRHTSIVVLCNSDGISPDGLSDQVADIVLAKDFPAKTLAATTAGHAKPSTVPAVTTSRLVGSYFDSTTDEVYGVVDTGGGTPALKFAGRTFPLQATGLSTFAVPGLPVSVTFSVGDTGPARALRLEVASEDRPEATRFTPAPPTPDSLRAYAGPYDSPELGVSWSVTVDKDHLVLAGPIPVVEIAGSLEPAMTDGFTAPGAFIRFTRDGFELSASRMKGIRFDRRPAPSGLAGQPADAPAAWKSLIGDYGAPADSSPVTVFERAGELLEAKKGEAPSALTPDSARRISLPHRDYVSATGNFYVHPVRPVDELRRDALRAKPPAEAGPFRTPDLVDIAALDPAIHLDIRYASTTNFLRTPVYTEARAFLQRPAADALIRILKELKPLGYGLLIHDAYRPWFVTKIFWDATPPEGKIFVADPSQGSRHNRGCAVDLTLYDLTTGQPIEMPGTYDEQSQRSFPTYLGGTSLERWHRDLLRAAMESEGFSVYDAEWWHFDYKDWKQYPILNTPFEKLEHQ
jgi:CubicO group peptidase (beta-lactamase class C family)/D-alanyl-D-alanine dipeptidase